MPRSGRAEERCEMDGYLVAVDLPVLPGRKSAPGSGRLPGSGGGDSGQHRVDGQIGSQLATLMT